MLAPAGTSPQATVRSCESRAGWARVASLLFVASLLAAQAAWGPRALAASPVETEECDGEGKDVKARHQRAEGRHVVRTGRARLRNLVHRHTVATVPARRRPDRRNRGVHHGDLIVRHLRFLV